MIDDDLKSCPFCGSRGATCIGATNRGTIFYEIRCVNLQCEIKTRRYRTRAEVKDALNRRASK